MPVDSNTNDDFSDQWLLGILREETPDKHPLSDPQINSILKRGKYHGVLSLLHYKIADQSEYPDALQQALQRHARHVVGAELARIQELNKLFKLFTKADISFLLLKGSVLAHTLYPQSHLRERCDTDLLLPDKKASEDAWNLLDAAGYERRTTLQGEFVGYQYNCYRQLPGGLYHALDIHSKINDYGFFARLFEYEELRRHSQIIPELNLSISGLNPVWSMAIACIHHATNIPQGNADRFIWIYDIHLLASSFDKQQWQELSDLVIEKQIAGICLNTLKISIKLFDTAVPKTILENLFGSGKTEQLQPQKMKTRRDMYKLDFLNNKGGRNKLRQLREHLFPSASYMKQKYSLDSAIKLPYYYIHRIIRGLIRYS
jgi:hypothetical protein